MNCVEKMKKRKERKSVLFQRYEDWKREYRRIKSKRLGLPKG